MILVGISNTFGVGVNPYLHKGLHMSGDTKVWCPGRSGDSKNDLSDTGRGSIEG